MITSINGSQVNISILTSLKSFTFLFQQPAGYFQLDFLQDPQIQQIPNGIHLCPLNQDLLQTVPIVPLSIKPGLYCFLFLLSSVSCLCELSFPSLWALPDPGPAHHPGSVLWPWYPNWFAYLLPLLPTIRLVHYCQAASMTDPQKPAHGCPRNQVHESSGSPQLYPGRGRPFFTSFLSSVYTAL